MSDPKLQFWILSRNRAEFLRESLCSAVAQKRPGMEIIVSDNSDNDYVEEMMKAEFPEVTLIRRRPVLAALEHFRTIFEEAKGKYITLFHDDDVLSPGYIDEMVSLLDLDPESAAVACDAWIIREKMLTSDLMIGRCEYIRYFSTSEQLLLPYMQFSKLGPAPFPGYMYRAEKIKGLSLDPELGGKYADVSFLAEIVKRGTVIISNKPLMQYRIHSNNDNVTEHIGSRLRLLRYVLSHTGFNRRSKAVRHFRFRYWLRWFKEQKMESGNPKRVAVVKKFLFLTGAMLVLTEPGFWMRFLNRARK